MFAASAAVGCTGHDGNAEPGEAVARTTQELGAAPASLTFETRIDGRELLISLRRIPAPVVGDYGVLRLGADGRITERASSAPDCLYEGALHDSDTGAVLPGSFVSASTCLRTAGHGDGLTLHGTFAFADRLWTITPEPGDATAGAVPHRVITTTDLRAARDAGQRAEGQLVSVRRSAQVMPHTLPYLEGTPQETKYIELFFVNDAARVAELAGAPAAEAEAVALAAEVNTIMAGAGLEPRVRVVLSGQLTFDVDPYGIDTTGGANADLLLDAFQAWADTAELPHHDLHALLSGHEFQGDTIGLAPLGGMCWPGISGLIVQATTDLLALPAETTVHELGHTLGMDHDGSDNACPASGFLMAPFATNGGLASPAFSECSREQFVAFLEDGFMPGCIDNLPTTVAFDNCGDGVVTGGEACDCGGEDCSEIDPCCDGSTCQLAAGAECSGYTDACCVECKIAPRDTVCREARDACDSEEVCDGVDAACPGDTWPRGGAECIDDLGYLGTCFEGNCTTRGAQCEGLNATFGGDFGPPTESCLASGDPCGDSRCADNEEGQCAVFLGLAVSDGISCGEGLQCQQGECLGEEELDECPSDDDKLWPGECGCGVPDTDGDDDGTPDCADLCAEDPDKTLPGECGCGTPDGDADGDGVLDCVDECPTDAQKTAPGECGCGIAETECDRAGDVIDDDMSGPGSGDAPEAGADDAGCSCRLVGTSSPGPGWWSMGALVPWLLRRRGRTARPGAAA